MIEDWLPLRTPFRRFGETLYPLTGGSIRLDAPPVKIFCAVHKNLQRISNSNTHLIEL
jgi:hypothetical protein